MPDDTNLVADRQAGIGGDQTGDLTATNHAYTNPEGMIARHGEMADLYVAGLSLDEIASRLGYASANSVAVVVHRLRHEYGYDLPYRERPYRQPVERRRLADG